MSELQETYYTYASQPSVDGTTDLRVRLFSMDTGQEPVPLIIWFHSGAFHAGSIDAKAHYKIAKRFVERGYSIAFVQYRLRGRDEDLLPETRRLLPELVQDAAENCAEIRPNMTGARALAAMEDSVVFLNWISERVAEFGLSGRYILGGSSAGGMNILNLLSLAPRLGIALPEIPTAWVLSGAFTYPSYFTASNTRVLALHGSHDRQLPVSSIRAYAANPAANCTLLEDRDNAHGSLPLTQKEPLWQAVERLIAFDKGQDFTSARTDLTSPELGPAKNAHKICVYTCVRDEGPFLLEWIAHNRAIGVTDFVIFSNDCNDGTYELLDRLDETGIVNHIRNPSMALNSREHLKLTVACAPFHIAFFKSDYVIFTDVDKFIQINTADRTLNGLIAGTGYPDVISLSECLFGFGGVTEFRDALVTEQFQVADDTDPPPGAMRRGVKSITKFSSFVTSYSNHRPQLTEAGQEEAVWVDGTGGSVPQRFAKGPSRGFDPAGKYRLARVNHYTLRSADSMLLKFRRGDAVRPGRMRPDNISERNGNAVHDFSFAPHLPGLRAELERLRQDPVLTVLHEDCVRKHAEIIAQLKTRPRFAQIWQTICEEAARPIGDVEHLSAAE